jgi:hypothetical protein
VVESYNHLPSTPANVIGTQGTDTSEVTEWDLDSQVILAIASTKAALSPAAPPENMML